MADQEERSRQTQLKQCSLLIFHIGDTKTGSTSIQDTLATKGLRIEGQFPFYSSPLAHNHLVPYFRTLAQGGNPEEVALAHQKIAELAQEIRDSGYRHSVISAELFAFQDADRFKAIVDEHFSGVADKIRVVAYVRPHAQWITATFAEQLKIGDFRGDLDQFYEQRCEDGVIFPYHDRFSRWQTAFGARFHLRPFVRSALAGESVITDFAATAFPGTKCEVFERAASNEALSLEDLLRIQILQDKMTRRRWIMRHHFGWELTRQVGLLGPTTATSATKVQMHRALAEKIRSRFLDDAKIMDRDFFSGQGYLEDGLHAMVDNACADKQSVDPGDYFSASELRSLHLFAEVINELIDIQPHRTLAHLEKKRIATRDSLYRAVAN